MKGPVNAFRMVSLALLLSGCTIVKHTAQLPAKTVAVVIPTAKGERLDPAILQSVLLRYADDFSGRTSVGIDEYERQVKTAAAEKEALTWRLALNSAVLGIGTGANPAGNLVDFLSLSSLTKAFVEQKAVEAGSPGAFDVWLENSRALEANAWKIAEKFFTEEQLIELRRAIKAWLEKNAGQGPGFFRRAQDLASSIRQEGEARNQPGSVFSLVGLDPTAGLDPAVREITRSRLFAERALYAAQRMPFLLKWQIELLAKESLSEVQVTNALASTERLSRAAEQAARVASELPDRITEERKAILASLEAQEGDLQKLSAEVGQTLAAGERMSGSLNTTIQSMDALMKRFGVGELSVKPPRTNSPPFNILDYARTAEQVALMAQQVDALIKDAGATMDAPALDKRIAQLDSLSARAKKDAKSVLNHAFLVGAGLILLAFLCALAWTRFARRRSTAILKEPQK